MGELLPYSIVLPRSLPWNCNEVDSRPSESGGEFGRKKVHKPQELRFLLCLFAAEILRWSGSGTKAARNRCGTWADALLGSTTKHTER